MTTKLTLRIPDALRDRLKATAEKECISLNALIVRVLSGLQAAPSDPSDDAEIARLNAIMRSWGDAKTGGPIRSGKAWLQAAPKEGK